MPTRFQSQKFAPEHVAEAAALLADRHKRHRQAWPSLDPKFEDGRNCEPLLTERLERGGALGAVAIADGHVAGYVLTTPREDATWGPNAWAEDVGSAGDGEAVRVAYAAIAGDLVDAGIRGHWAMVPASDDELIEAWFSMSFGVQHVYALQASVSTDFQPRLPDELTIRRPTREDIPVMAQLDLVLPEHVSRGPVFSTLRVPTLAETQAELAQDFDDPKYSLWVAEREGAIVSELVGLNLHDSPSWTPLMKPVSAGFLGFAATLPSARGLGAGRALTDVFKAWARDSGYQWLATDWRSTNVEANRTWQAMGFVPHYLRLYRAIPG
jgi:ribosomal protein S18 acetylase RimI-like enzyme